ncbi:uncharacterized protein LOC62_01G000145 [Vanrija pseudolonga]|uniref:Uncharacterized protein n=1 Tax=Vanrija pseudolonga TaxID=143232 RepID=A0AAF0Y1U4_9TREE|nr:hypothetical protein LOC62_01G000145 [Vanrija pseudolonga]
MPSPRGLPPDGVVNSPPPVSTSKHLARASVQYRKSNTSTATDPSFLNQPRDDGNYYTEPPPAPSALCPPTTLAAAKNIAPSIAITPQTYPSSGYFPRQSQLSGYSTVPSMYSGTDWGVEPVLVDGRVIDMRVKHDSLLTSGSSLPSFGAGVRQSSNLAHPSPLQRASGTTGQTVRPRLSAQDSIRHRDSHGSSRTRYTVAPPTPAPSLANDTPRPPTPPPKSPSLRPRDSVSNLRPESISTSVSSRVATPTPDALTPAAPPSPYGPGPAAYLQIECLLPEYACSHPTLYSSPRFVDLSGTVNWISPHRVARTTESVDAVWASLRNVVALLHVEAASRAEYTPPSSSRPGQAYPVRRSPKEVPWASLRAVLDTSPRIVSRPSSLREKVTSTVYKAASKFAQSTTSLDMRDNPKPTADVPLRSETGSIAVPISTPINFPSSLVKSENKRHAIYLPGPTIPMPRARDAPPSVPEPSPRIEKKQWAAIRATLAVLDAHCATAAGLDAQMADINNGTLPFNVEMAADPAIDLAVHIALIRLLCSTLLESYAATEFNRRTGRCVRSLVRHVVAVGQEFGGEYVYIERVRSRTLAELKEAGVVLRPVGLPAAGHVVPMVAAKRKPPTIRFASDTATTSIKSTETFETAKSDNTPSILKTSESRSKTASMLSKLSRRPRLPESWGATPKSAAPVPPPKL